MQFKHSTVNHLSHQLKMERIAMTKYIYGLFNVHVLTVTVLDSSKQRIKQKKKKMKCTKDSGADIFNYTKSSYDETNNLSCGTNGELKLTVTLLHNLHQVICTLHTINNSFPLLFFLSFSHRRCWFNRFSLDVTIFL